MAVLYILTPLLESFCDAFDSNILIPSNHKDIYGLHFISFTVSKAIHWSLSIGMRWLTEFSRLSWMNLQQILILSAPLPQTKCSSPKVKYIFLFLIDHCNNFWFYFSYSLMYDQLYCASSTKTSLAKICKSPLSRESRAKKTKCV